MTEPVSTTALGILGIKPAQMVAGLIGGVISLAFVRDLKRWQMALAVLAGGGCASYLTPVLASYLHLGDNLQAQNGMAFVLGLCGMNIVPAVRAMVTKVALRKADNIVGGP